MSVLEVQPRAFRLRLVGSYGLLDPDDRDRTPSARKVLSMLVFTALQPNGRAQREQLIGLLWGDRSQPQAQASLRQALVELRRALTLGDECIVDGDRSWITLDKSRIDVDLDQLVRLVAAGDPGSLVDATELLDGELLPDLEVPAMPFREWLEAERNRRVAAMTRTIEKSIEWATANGQDDSIEGLANALLGIDHAHEGAHRTLIELHVRRGAPAAALRQYEQCRRALAQAYEVEPSLALKALVASIRTVKVATEPVLQPKQPVRSVLRRLPIVAVMVQPPFGPPGQTQELSLLFEDAVVAALSRFRTFSTQQLGAGQQSTEPADYMLRLYVRNVETTRDLSVRLTNNGNLFQIFSMTIELDDDLSIVLRKITAVALAVEQLIRNERHATPLIVPNAYDLWLAGDRLAEQFRKEAFEQAVPLLNQAAAADPGFARPLSGLASIELSRQFLMPGIEWGDESRARATRLAQAAIAIDPWDSYGHMIAAWAYLRQRQPEPARRHFEQGLSLNAQDPMTLIACAEGFAHLGMIDQAMRCGERAFQIHLAPPAYFHWYMTVVHVLAGSYDQALVHAELGPDSVPELAAWRAMALAAAGKPAEARQAGNRFIRQLESSWVGKGRMTLEQATTWLSDVSLISDERRRQAFVENISRSIG